MTTPNKKCCHRCYEYNKENICRNIKCYCHLPQEKEWYCGNCKETVLPNGEHLCPPISEPHKLSYIPSPTLEEELVKEFEKKFPYKLVEHNGKNYLPHSVKGIKNDIIDFLKTHLHKAREVSFKEEEESPLHISAEALYKCSKRTQELLHDNRFSTLKEVEKKILELKEEDTESKGWDLFFDKNGRCCAGDDWGCVYKKAIDDILQTLKQLKK